MLCSGGYGNIAAIGKGYEFQRILQALLCGDVAGDDGQRIHLNLRRVECKDDRYCIVGARVGIDDHPPWCSYGEGCQYNCRHRERTCEPAAGWVHGGILSWEKT